EIGGGQSQTILLTIRNGNGSYDVNSVVNPFGIQSQDTFVMTFSSSCITQVVSVTNITTSLAGSFSSSITASNRFNLTFSGQTQPFEASDFIRVSVKVTAATLGSNCSLPMTDPNHPQPAACGVTLEAIGPGNYNPTSVQGTLARACPQDLGG